MHRVFISLAKHKYLVIFTLVYFALCFSLYKDFGATYDEKTEYDAGRYLKKYYQNSTKHTYVEDLVKFNPRRINNWQLPLFSHYSRVYPMLVNLLNPNYFLEWFHVQNIFSGYFMFFFSYVLFYLVYSKSKFAILSSVLLFLTPLLIGHIPANPKDIPFATSMLLGVFGIYFFNSYLPSIKKSNSFLLLTELLVLGILFGISQSLRAVGLTLFIGYMIHGCILSKSSKEVFFVLFKSVLVGLVSMVVWVLSVPFIGANVVANLIDVFSGSYGFSQWNGYVLYLGDFLTKDHRPWHYLFVYLAIQLPITTLFGLLGGLVAVLFKKLRYDRNHPLIIILIIVLLNLLLYLTISPVIYNGIRHFLYLITFITLLASFFILDLIIKFPKIKWVPFGILLYCGFTFYRLAILHPYEYTYYNEFIGGLKGAEGKFELDYWGTAYRDASYYVVEIAEKNDLKDLRVFACDNHFAVDYYSNLRFKRVSASKDSDIILCDTFKVRVRRKTGQKSYTSTHALVKSIDREGVPLNFIYARPEFVRYFNP